MPSSKTTPPLRGTPPQEGNAHPKDGAQNSPPLEGWQAQPDAQFPSAGGVARSDGVVVPKLRFPEFREAGAWKTETLGSVATISTEKVGDQSCIPMSITSGVGLVSQQDKFGRIIAGSSYKNYLQLKQNDFAYNKSATKEYPEGYLALYSGEALAAVPNSIFTCFRINGTSPAPKYLDYLFHCNLHGKWLQKFIQVGARAHGSLSINDSDLLALPVPLPEGPLSLTEQQKIADCFASLDERITLEAQKLDTLKTHKKGLMQQLFPAVGETLPKLRFPEFRDAGEWDERELGPLTIKVGSGITPTGGDKNYKTKGRPFVRSQNVGWGELILNDVAFIDEETHQSFDSTEIKVSDVLLNITGASIGRSAVADSRIVGGNVNQHVCIIRAQQVELNPALLNHFLISERGQKQIDSFQAGGNRQGLNFAQIRSFVIPLPPTEHEQRRIATCLASLDDLITAQTQKLAALKTHKKGLMQQLFPSVGGVPEGQGGSPSVGGVAGEA